MPHKAHSPYFIFSVCFSRLKKTFIRSCDYISDVYFLCFFSLAGFSNTWYNRNWVTITTMERQKQKEKHILPYEFTSICLYGLAL